MTTPAQRLLERIGALVEDDVAIRGEHDVYRPSDSLGVKREDMPQISKDAIRTFRKELRARGVAVTRERVAAKDLKPTQAEMNKRIARNIIKSSKSDVAEISRYPIIVSSDDYVLDGHHRWLATHLLDKNHEMAVHRVDLPIRKLLAAARKSKASTRKHLGEDIDTALALGHRLDEGLVEGVHDPNTLKAVFMAGGGGSGKTFFSQKMFADSGLRVVNSDDLTEFLVKRAGLSLKKDMGTDKVQKEIRPKAKDLTAKKFDTFVSGRMGLIIDGTGANPEKILKQKKQLEDLGYDTHMVVVNTPLETALENNKKRARTVPEDIVKADWHSVQDALGKYKEEFGEQNFVEVKNDRIASDDDLRQHLAPKLARAAGRLVGGTLRNPKGHEWIDKQVGDTDDTKVTHRGSDARKRSGVDKQNATAAPAKRTVSTAKFSAERFLAKHRAKLERRLGRKLVQGQPTGAKRRSAKPQNGKGHFVTMGGHPVFIPDGKGASPHSAKHSIDAVREAAVLSRIGDVLEGRRRTGLKSFGRRSAKVVNPVTGRRTSLDYFLSPRNLLKFGQRLARKNARLSRKAAKRPEPIAQAQSGVDDEPLAEMAARYVEITREEFERFLDESWGEGNWNPRAGSVGVYRLKLSPKCSVEVSSSIGSADRNMGVGAAAIHVRMVSRRYGRVLNKKAIGKSRLHRTTNWRSNVAKAFQDVREEYMKRPYFYDAIAEPDEYKRDTLARLERVPGWQSDKYVSSFHAQVSGGAVLTDAQRSLLNDRYPVRESRLVTRIDAVLEAAARGWRAGAAVRH